MKIYVEPNYINGEWVKSEGRTSFENIDPCTEQTITKYPCTTHSEVIHAVQCARKAFETWRNVSRVQRA